MSRVYEALRKAERERSVSGASGVPQRSWIRARPPTVVQPVDFVQPAPAAPSVQGEAPSRVVGLGRYSRASDEFQLLASHLEGTAEQERRVVMVASSTPGEGKSFVSLNLSISLARLGRRVLLVDVDLRNPKLHRTFNLAPLGGLTGFLLDQLPLASCLCETSVRNLTLIAASSRAAVFSSEILASPRMRQFVAEARAADAWDHVVLDSAPVLAASETQIVARLADALLFVVAANRTPRSAVSRSLELLKGAPLLGLVFNRFEPPYSNRAEYGYGYGYGYGSRNRSQD